MFLGGFMQKNKFLIFRAILILLFFSFGFVSAQNYTFVLDPGHGGPHPGCAYNYNGKTILEKDLNLKIAKYLKDELQKYKSPNGEDIVIHMTRNNDKSCPTLAERVKFAKKKKAKAFISLHNNANETPQKNKVNGCMVLVTHSNYNKLYKEEHNLGKSIIKELNNVGVKTAKISNAKGKNAGLLRKIATDGSKYPNGDKADWFGIVMRGVQNKIPAVIVEHAYMSNKNDYQKFLSSDEKLKKLAIADAKGIAKHYKLKAKNK